MAQFHYEGVNASGESVRGKREGVTAYEVMEQLVREGISASSLRREGPEPGFVRGRRPLRAEDVALLSEQLMSIAGSGLPLAPAVQALARDVERGRLRPVLESLQQDLENGRNLEEALSRFPESFSPTYLSLVRAGEETGNLPGVLAQLCTYLRRGVDLRYRLQEILAYPVVMLVFFVLFLSFFASTVVPQFDLMYKTLGGRLPWSTEAVLRFGRLLHLAGWNGIVAALILTLCAWGLLRWYTRTAGGRIRFDLFKIRIPVLGRIHRAAALSRFCNTLGLLLSNGAPLVSSVDLAAAASGNAALRYAGFKAAQRMAQGEDIAESLAATRWFMPSVCWVMRHGVAQGRLEETMLRLANTYEREVVRRDRMALMILGPLATLTIGCLVGGLVTALFQPIFHISGLVGGF